MRISLLLEREPFPEILERTLERFLPQLTGKRHSVRWSSKSESPVSDAQPWYCNHHLNAIFSRGALPDVFRPVVGEFSRSSSLWRRPFQRGYVALASSPRFASVLAQSRVEVSPPIPEAGDWLIVGGNHKIRLLNHRTQSCYSVLKEGFDVDFLRSEVSARRLATEQGVSVPLVQQTADDETWFLEEYVAGIPLNRLESRVAAKNVLDEAMGELKQLFDATARAVEIRFYTQSLARAARESLALARVIDAALRQRIEDCLGRLLDALESSEGQSVATSRCHGDLHPGNILCTSEGHRVIDWEYAGRRQVGHDLLVYRLQTRFPRGLARRLQSFVASGMESWEEEDRVCRQRTASLLALEELELNLREIRNPSFFSVGDSFPILIGELEAWLRGKDGDR